ncbi:unnamed protein product, partial [Rotaria magnacalcarata]
MAKTNAERMKKYREKRKKDSVKYETAKAKARARNNSIKTKLSGASLAEFRSKAKLRQRKCRENKIKRLINKPSSSSFKTRQSFSKSLKKVKSSLPKCDGKKKVVIQHLAEKFGLVPKSKHQRITLQLADKLKIDIHNFYQRDDISYQLPDENKSVDLSRSSFADLRPAFVVSKSALTHRNCLCVYHENVRLLLRDVDKYVDGTQCSSLSTFTDSL